MSMSHYSHCPTHHWPEISMSREDGGMPRIRESIRLPTSDRASRDGELDGITLPPTYKHQLSEVSAPASPPWVRARPSPQILAHMCGKGALTPVS